MLFKKYRAQLFINLGKGRWFKSSSQPILRIVVASELEQDLEKETQCRMRDGAVC